MAYHKFKCPETGEEHGSFEVFEITENLKAMLRGAIPNEIGWYWWPCVPGCLPDTDDDAIGPFATEQEAIDDARGE